MRKFSLFVSFIAESVSNVWDKSFNSLYMALKYPDYELEDIMSDSDIKKLNNAVDNMRRDRIKETKFKTSEGITYIITIL